MDGRIEMLSVIVRNNVLQRSCCGESSVIDGLSALGNMEAVRQKNSACRMMLVKAKEQN